MSEDLRHEGHFGSVRIERTMLTCLVLRPVPAGLPWCPGLDDSSRAFHPAVLERSRRLHAHLYSVYACAQSMRRHQMSQRRACVDRTDVRM